jgi:MscS family membrane protein
MVRSLRFSAFLLLVSSYAAATGDPLGRSTPRSAVLGFLHTAQEQNYTVAAQYLEANSANRDLPMQLKTVLDRRLNIDLAAINNDPAGDQTDGLAPARELIGTISTSEGSVPVALHRVNSANGEIWLFSADTLAKVPAIFRTIEPSIIERYLPGVLTETQLFGAALWRWIALLLMVPVAIALALIVAKLVLWITAGFARRTTTDLDDEIIAKLCGPLRLFLAVSFFHPGLLLLALPLLTRQAVGDLETMLAAAAFVWFLLRLIDIAAERTRAALVRTHRFAATAVVPLGRRILKVLAVVSISLVVLDNFGFQMSTVLAGLGVGGIAVALASQKTIENLFAGISIVIDQPVRVGDFCKFGDNVGTVLDIGLRSTRIQTLDRTVITIPNAQFAAINIENFGPREKVWFHPVFGLRIDTTADQMRYVLAGIRKLLYEHPKVEAGARVRLIGFAADALTLEIFSYVLTADYNEFVAIQEDLLLRILEVIADAGTSLAMPVQTNYLARGAGLDHDLRKAAIDTVREWKEDGRLPFPDFSPRDVEQMQNKLPYPPPESVLRNGAA